MMSLAWYEVDAQPCGCGTEICVPQLMRESRTQNFKKEQRRPG